MSKAINIDGYSIVIPEKDDPCDLWISYFNSLKKAVGISRAKTLWLITWKHSGAISCTTRPAFTKWMQSKGIDVSNIATRTFSDLSEIQGNLFGLGKSLTKVIAIGVPALLVTVIIGIVIIGRKAVNEVDLDTLKTVTPIGRASKLLLK